jgi:hypothetical protein
LKTLAVFVAFGAVGLLMARSARNDWRRGDGVDHLFWGWGRWWAVVLAFAVAILGPLAILFG